MGFQPALVVFLCLLEVADPTTEEKAAPLSLHGQFVKSKAPASISLVSYSPAGVWSSIPRPSVEEPGFWIALPEPRHLPPTYPGANVIRALSETGSWAIQETVMMEAILSVHHQNRSSRVIDAGLTSGTFLFSPPHMLTRGLLVDSMACDVAVRLVDEVGVEKDDAEAAARSRRAM
eukprot:CAMPEP_0172589212 /NCGR_PEP_ID=MMETSP1068-20121228/8001_1 /TAXON_ID=35684 /ORGANISM="Pseudopedinella elastica, Strain CCMP716" /LENGTH=175 /DNA_ID=CAMNT_0013384759 /DNA_START=28 /DNA_END=553 /DNA_ORIENTATION=+